MGRSVMASIECLDIKGWSILKKIEMCGRICYNSEDKVRTFPNELIGKCGSCIAYVDNRCGKDIIVEDKIKINCCPKDKFDSCEKYYSYDTAEGFVKGIINSGHESVIEHEGLIFVADDKLIDHLQIYSSILFAAKDSVLLKVSHIKETGKTIVSGNIRAWRDYIKADYTSPLAQSVDHSYSVPSVLKVGIPIIYELTSIFDCAGVTSITDVWKDYIHNENVVMKHGTLTFRIDGVSRALTHQLVRHRLCAYSQRSQRFCGEGNFNYIVPPSIYEDKSQFAELNYPDFMRDAGDRYIALKHSGIKNEDARFVLPNACETNIVVTATLNQWLHMIKLRTDPHAQWEIRNVFKMIHEQICDITNLQHFKEIIF